MTEQDIQMWLGVVTLFTTGLLFPFVLHFFKKNEKLHEDTRNKMETHSVTLAGHEIRIVSLEEYRRWQTQPTVSPTQTTINN